MGTVDSKGRQSTVKNRKAIEIPDVLDLKAHVYHPQPKGTPRPLRYKLTSVLNHDGDTTTSGHWTTGVSHPVPKDEREAWAKENIATIRRQK